MLNVSPVFASCVNPITQGLYLTVPKTLHRPEHFKIYKDGPALMVVHRWGRSFKIAADAKLTTILLEDGSKVCVVDFTVCQIYIAHEKETRTFFSLSEGILAIEKRCLEAT